MRQIHQMFTTMMTKLGKLDAIEADMKEIKHSLQFAHAEIVDLKKENDTNKANQAEAKKKIERLEQDNTTLRNKIVIGVRAHYFWVGWAEFSRMT